MKRTALLVLSILMVITSAFGQDQAIYQKLIDQSNALYKDKNYLAAAQKTSEAFVAWGNMGMVMDRYNAACCWALAGLPDSAFVQLNKIATKGHFADLRLASSDADLESLRADERWGKFITQVTANKDEAEAGWDKPLVAALDTIYDEDQKYRRQLDDVEKEHGRDSKEIKALWKTISEKDAINLIRVRKILDERGWLGPDSIGPQGNATLFLVIQHADRDTQVKYLPMMRKAVQMGNAVPNDLALLEDRVALGNGEKQIYGSQIGRDKATGEYYVLPLVDPDNVDNRRKEVDLEPLQDYVSNWGITWNVEEYKKKLPAIEAMQK